MSIYIARRIRLTEPAFVNYTGPFGPVNFTDGLSDDKVEWQEASRLAANVRCEDADMPGYQLGEVAEGERHRLRKADAPVIRAMEVAEKTDTGLRLASQQFTREELAKIADEKGLAGVRDIARAWGKTGRSIEECIAAILNAQEPGYTDRVEKGPASEAAPAIPEETPVVEEAPAVEEKTEEVAEEKAE